MGHHIKPGQIYESCQPTHVVDGQEVHTRIKVVGEPIGTHGLYGFGKVSVVTLTDDGRGVRPRHIKWDQLNESGTTNAGEPRRTGYRLVKEA